MTVIGANVRRIDGVEKVSGQGLYAGDLRLPGLAYAKVLRSPLPHARIRRIDSSKAAALNGVVAIVSRDNLNVASNAFGAYVKDQQILATDKVRYVGDMVAAVAAVDEVVAEAALRLIDVEYEELPAVYTIEEALKRRRSAGAREPGRAERSALWAGWSSHRPRSEQCLFSFSLSSRKR